MDKNAIKKYAVWARRELIEKVSQKALQYGIEEGKGLDPKLESINGVLLSDVEKKQRQALISKINQSGYTQVIEEVAYTWFNRFIALRFMEVNGYLPSHVRVFTNEEGEFKPQIMSEALHLEIEGIDVEKVYELKNDNRDDDLFKYLLITQCNALSGIFPRMFQRIEDYTELLLPDYLLRDGSVIEQMVNQKDGIPEADWQDQVQILGWLYQYYNVEPKDKAFADLKKNIKISKDKIAAATQLFTPDWIVHYMVENSLGRLWIENNNSTALKSELGYYLDDITQDIEIQNQIKSIQNAYAGIKPEEIRCIDPCMGSGHILCVLFDVLIKIYEDYGYPAREAVVYIVKNNIWGLDIDDRAAQLAYFAVMMKARQYDRRFFTKGVQPNVYAIEESNGLEYEGDYGDFLLDEEQQKTMAYLFDTFKDAKEYGSLLEINEKNYEKLLDSWKLLADQTLTDIRMYGWYMYAGERVISLINQARALSQKYDVVVTNPPYMVLSNGSPKLVDYVKKYFDEGKADLFSAFISRCKKMTKANGFQAMITQHSWMYLSSFEKLRREVLENQIYSLVHLGAHAFEEIGGEVVQTVAFVLRNAKCNDYVSSVVRLVDYGSEKEKEEAYLAGQGINCVKMSSFFQIEGCPIAYRATNRMLEVFDESKQLSLIANPRQGLISGDVNRFVRKWYECEDRKTSFTNDKSKKWFPYNNGGECRRWYGNNEDVVNWENNGYEIQNFRDDKGKQRSRPQNQQYYFQEGATWTAISSGKFSVRYFPEGFLFSNAGMAIYCEHTSLLYLIGFMNSKLSQIYLHLFNEGLNYNQGDIAKLPVIMDSNKKNDIIRIVNECVRIEKEDWDSYETSWDFPGHPMVRKNLTLVEEAYNMWERDNKNRIHELMLYEEELNRTFIEIYGLAEEVSYQIERDDITIRDINPLTAVKSLISYAVGCMFGRYSLDREGVILAGGELTETNYDTFMPDKDGIIPICDDEYFIDDIAGLFVDFIEAAYGKDNLDINLQYIAKVIGGTGTSREIIRKYFINDFYADHLKIYQKRPIYWLFDSGKKSGFKCLVYIHRYKPDTIARIRTDYVHEQQSRYRTAIEEIENRLSSSSGSEKVKLNKKLNTLKAQEEEIHTYEEKIHHIADQMIEIDLDDGIKHNYAIFKDVLAKI